MNEFPSLRNHKYLFADTETTGLKRYDKPVGFSYALSNENKGYLSWGHEGGENTVGLDNFKRWWKAEVIERDVTVVFHNAPFDMRMMTVIDCAWPKRVEDTGIIVGLLDEYRQSYSLESLAQDFLGPGHFKDSGPMNAWLALTFGGKIDEQGGNIWRAPANIVSAYAIEDANLVRKIYHVVRPLLEKDGGDSVYNKVELPLIRSLVRMYLAGVKVDLERARSEQGRLKSVHFQMVKEIEDDAGIKNLKVNSSQQLAKILEAAGIEVPVKLPTAKMIAKAKEKGLIAIGNKSVTGKWLETLEHPSAKKMVVARKSKHYFHTFIESYIFNNVTSQSTIHPNFHAIKREGVGTTTARFSSSGGLNAQNIPSREEEWALPIKRIFIPYYEGGQFATLDYSQIEYRFFAHFAGGQIKQAYVSDPDIDFHDMVAALTGIPRKYAKGINFGVLFGMGQAKMMASLNRSAAEARSIIETYHERIPQARKMSSKAAMRAAKRGYVITWGERHAHFPKMNGIYINTHKALNKLVQTSAADLIKTAMAAISEEIDWVSTIMHLTIHDSLQFTVPPGGDGIKQSLRLREIMQDVGASVEVPVRASLEVGPNWGDVIAIAN